ncbi:MAG: ABC transporter permease, partial [Burkholderiales bacterium]|nr:ABC transporter permease [Anaerolineae bacterium]
MSLPRIFVRTFSTRYMVALLLAIVIFVMGSYLIDGFSSAFSVRAMSVLAALLAITAVGQTLVILIGGIDLSIPFL